VNQKKYPVPVYLAKLRRADRSEKTISLYSKVFKGYAQVIGVPVDLIHENMSQENIDTFIDYRNKNGRSKTSTKTYVGILYRFMKVNGYELDAMDEMQANGKKGKSEHNDKVLTQETLQRMMDLGNPHARAWITFLISTGCRSGEASEILLSDVKGDTVIIRDEIAKGGRGGIVYLSSEAREFLDLWLKDRGEHIRINKERTRGMNNSMPEHDQRLFASSYSGLRNMWTRLYEQVDGEKSKYGRRAISMHSCRRFFRSHLSETVSVDIVEKLMRHEGYLTGAYVRIPEDEVKTAFKAGETALYITRPDQRIQKTEITAVKAENEELRARLAKIEAFIKEYDFGISPPDKIEKRNTSF